MNARIFNACLLLGWLMITGGLLLVSVSVALVVGGVLLMGVTLVLARWAGVTAGKAKDTHVS
jgi:hypothetical protein